METYETQGRSRGGGGGHLPPPFFPERQEFYLYLNELLPQIVDLVVLTRYSLVWASWHEYRECGFLIVGVVSG